MQSFLALITKNKRSIESEHCSKMRLVRRDVSFPFSLIYIKWVSDTKESFFLKFKKSIL